MSAQRPEPGTEVVFQFRKWDGSPHWRHECVYLGSDEWGEWLGQPRGWGSSRPGRSFVAGGPFVTLLPPSGDWALTANRHRGDGMRIYVDLAWDVRPGDVDGTPDPLLFTGIDMDLDVVRVEGDRGTWIDDEDEWEQHRVHYGYPDEVQEHLLALTADLERRVRAQEAPFAEPVYGAWLDRLEALGLERPRLDSEHDPADA
ncbi:DUF402 domain-containing protein [Microbacterium sp. ASV81]|uniref:DUF402 domain-containing protein n=1 Tax=Microbacterium capsulatum TaxID=3041921 RepID=A0ABU0XHM3_9MICO|nr:DUF402 domain-containing protein [Microbacterium sp. ASV81]MDQ4214174.1 DUF402 domain-containing protein [Microbacterium sp. ASV81]